MMEKKFTVFVVDDEKPAQRKIELLLKQINSSFRYSGSAKNGKEALESYMISKPDLLLVDIQMPVMDGLEFIRKIKALDESQAVIIISCHENFSYAREAVQLGVLDYLIKDLLTKDELHTVLMKAENILNERGKDSLSFTETSSVSEKYIENNESVKRNNSGLLKLITQKSSQNINNSYISDNDFCNPPYAVMCLSIDDFRNISSNRVNIIDYIDNILSSMFEENSWGESAYCQNGMYAAVVSFCSFEDQNDIIRNSSFILNIIRKKLQKVPEITLSAGISELFFNVDELPDHYQKAYDLLKYRIFLGGGRTLFSSLQISKMPALKTEKIEKYLEEIKIYAYEKRFQKVLSAISDLYNTELSGILQYNYIQHIHTNLFSIIIDICKNNKITYNDLFGKNYLPVDRPESFNTIQESQDWFMEIFSRIIEISTEKKESYSNHVNKAVSVIVENPKITLHDLADKLFINKSYLSRLFKKETGRTVLEYTLEVRMNKAKMLLNDPSVRINEISEKLGYEYTQQFTSDFKKHTGISPTEFRNEQF